MSLLLLVAMCGYFAALWLRQPGVVSLIIVGVLAGPSGLGWITHTDFVTTLAHLGGVFLLFVVGLECKLSEILRVQSAVIAFFGAALPFAGGYLAAVAWGYRPPAAIILGTALTATSAAVASGVLREMRLVDTTVGRTIIGADAMDDVFGLLALAIGTQFTTGSVSLGVLAAIVGKAALFLVVGAVTGRALLVRVIARIDGSAVAKQFPGFVFAFAVLIAFLYAAASGALGLSAIVGAFLAGISLEGARTKVSRSFREGADYLRILFASIFFVSLGALVDLRHFGREGVLLAVVLTVVAILTKVIGCGVPARLLGLSNREALAVGFGMSPRGRSQCSSVCMHWVKA